MSRRFTAVLLFTFAACATEQTARAPHQDPTSVDAPEAPAALSLTAESEQADHGARSTGAAGDSSQRAPSVDAGTTHDHASGATHDHGAGTTHGHGSGTTHDRASETTHDPASGTGDAKPTVYVCPMHPEIQANGPERCAKCGMKLVPKSEGTP